MHTLGEALVQSSRLYTNQIAVEWGEEKLTYGQLSTLVLKVAARLQKEGYGERRQIVAFLFQNTPTALVGFLALAWLNSGTIPLDPNIPLPELEMMHQQLPFTTIMGESAQLRQFERFYAHSSCCCIDIAQLVAEESQGAPAEVVPPLCSTNDTFLYHFTSGSTGEPKAALHSQQNLVNGGLIYQQLYQVTHNDVIFVPIPLYHSFGMIGGCINALLSGARLVLTSRFIPSQIVSAIGQNRVTHLLATPMVYDLLARCALREPADMHMLRFCLSSGSPLSPETAQRFLQRFDKTIYSVYGCTEVGVIATRWMDETDWPEHATGRPVPGVQIRIIDEQGDALPAGRDGTLLVRTPAMFSDYYAHPAATASSFYEGWYITGDIASLDAEGHLSLVGRKDTFINVGGKKVNPSEVEHVLQVHPGVKEAIVFGQPVGNMGETVHAAVVLHEPVASDELISFCRQRLAFYKVPSHIQVHREFAKTSLGKIRRAEYTQKFKQIQTT